MKWRNASNRPLKLLRGQSALSWLREERGRTWEIPQMENKISLWNNMSAFTLTLDLYLRFTAVFFTILCYLLWEPFCTRGSFPVLSFFFFSYCSPAFKTVFMVDTAPRHTSFLVHVSNWYYHTPRTRNRPELARQRQVSYEPPLEGGSRLIGGCLLSARGGPRQGLSFGFGYALIGWNWIRFVFKQSDQIPTTQETVIDSGKQDCA